MYFQDEAAYVVEARNDSRQKSRVIIQTIFPSRVVTELQCQPLLDFEKHFPGNKIHKSKPVSETATQSSRSSSHKYVGLSISKKQNKQTA